MALPDMGVTAQEERYCCVTIALSSALLKRQPGFSLVYARLYPAPFCDFAVETQDGMIHAESRSLLFGVRANNRIQPTSMILSGDAWFKALKKLESLQKRWGPTFEKS